MNKGWFVGVALLYCGAVMAQPCGWVDGRAVRVDVGSYLVELICWNPKGEALIGSIPDQNGVTALGPVMWSPTTGDTVRGTTLVFVHPQMAPGLVGASAEVRGLCPWSKTMVVGFEVEARSELWVDRLEGVGLRLINDGNVDEVVTVLDAGGKVDSVMELVAGKVGIYRWDQTSDVQITTERGLDTLVRAMAPVLSSETKAAVTRDVDNPIYTWQNGLIWNPGAHQAVSHFVAGQFQNPKSMISIGSRNGNIYFSGQTIGLPLNLSLHRDGRGSSVGVYRNRSMQKNRSTGISLQLVQRNGIQLLQSSAQFQGPSLSVVHRNYGRAQALSGTYGRSRNQLYFLASHNPAPNALNSAMPNLANIGGRLTHGPVVLHVNGGIHQSKGVQRMNLNTSARLRHNHQFLSYEYFMPQGRGGTHRQFLRGGLGVQQLQVGAQWQQLWTESVAQNQFQTWAVLRPHPNARFEYRHALVRAGRASHTLRGQFSLKNSQYYGSLNHFNSNIYYNLGTNFKLFNYPVQLQALGSRAGFTSISLQSTYRFSPQNETPGIQGRITIGDKGVGGIVLQCEGRQIQSDPDGYFTFRHFYTEETTIEVIASSLPFGHRIVGPYSVATVNGSSVNFQLQRTSKGHGKIIAHSNSRFFSETPKWEDFKVIVWTVDNPDNRFEYSVNERGEFGCTLLEEKEYIIRVEGDVNWNGAEEKVLARSMDNLLIINVYEKDKHMVYQSM
jgi:hypothetical protein